MKNLNNTQRQKGLTLIELLLVLVVLIATAGVIVAVFPNIVGQSHAASSSANIEGIVRQISNHNALKGGYPNDLDLLLHDNADDTSLVPFGGGVAATELTVGAITARIADGLEEAGIDNLIEHPTGAEFLDEQGETYFTNGTDVAVDFTGPTPANIVTLGGAAITRLGLQPLSLDPTEGIQAYVVLGLGNSNTGVGETMAAAPVHFLPDGGNNAEVYSRFLLIFAVPAEGAARLATVASVDVHDGTGEVVGLDNHISEYHHNRE